MGIAPPPPIAGPLSAVRPAPPLRQRERRGRAPDVALWMQEQVLGSLVPGPGRRRAFRTEILS